eukprot:5230549-Pleurochrysis_carterae.AAC.2
MAAMFDGCSSSSLSRCPGSANCSVHWIEQQIDHFNWAPPFGNHSHTTYKQRYFIYDRFWKQAGPPYYADAMLPCSRSVRRCRENEQPQPTLSFSSCLHPQNAPVFFYLGNEDNVELYVNHTGCAMQQCGGIFCQSMHASDELRQQSSAAFLRTLSRLGTARAASFAPIWQAHVGERGRVQRAAGLCRAPVLRRVPAVRRRHTAVHELPHERAGDAPRLAFAT